LFWFRFSFGNRPIFLVGSESEYYYQHKLSDVRRVTTSNNLDPIEATEMQSAGGLPVH